MASAVGDRLDGVGGFDRSFWALSVVVVVGATMTILSTTSVNVALTSLSTEFDVPLGHVQWVVTGYLLALATVIPLSGWASERFGPRHLWIATVTLFALASVVCGSARSADTLIAARVLQGLAGGMIMPVGSIIVTLAVGPARIGRALSVIGVPMLLAPAFGPVLGGLFVEHTSWRWIFYLNVPAAIVGVALAWRLLPRSAPQHGRRLDWVGVLLISPGLALLTFGLAEIPAQGGLLHASVYGPLLGGALLLATFTLHELRVPDPLIDVRLFQNSQVSASLLTTLLLGAALFGSLVILPLYFQILRGEDALTTGLLLVPSGIGAALIMPFTGPLTDRYGGGAVVVAGITVLSLGTLAFTQLGPDTPYWLIAVMLAFRGIGLGACFMPAMVAGYAALPHAAVPRATSAMNVLQRVGGSFGAAMLTVILQAQIGSSADPRVVTAAFHATFWWAFALALIAMPPALVLARNRD
jgi:EmrB/QacA subfamily drug resistance transporter